MTTVRGDQEIGPIERSLDDFDVFVRDGRALAILQRVLAHEEESLAELVSARDPFGPALSSNFSDFRTKAAKGDVRLYLNKSRSKGEAWIGSDLVTKNKHLVDVWKVLIPKAGPGNSGGHVIPDMVLSQPLVAEPNSACTLSHIVIGPMASEAECASLASYLRSRFARFLVSLRKPSQDAPRSVYQWVPQQSWDRVWSDTVLYKKYGLSAEEIAFIESMIRPMEAPVE